MNKTGLSETARRTEEPVISWLMQMTLDRPELISLAAGFTDHESLPVRETRELLDEVLRSKSLGRAALQYGTTAGDPALRELTARRLQQQDGGGADGPMREAYSPERMLITNGSQQFLYLAAETLCDPGDIVLVEDPTYFVFLGITGARGVCCRGIRMTRDGVDPGHLEAVLDGLWRAGDLPRVKFLYLVSYFQNPSGVTTRFERKETALELLRRYEGRAGHPIYLIEDAAYRDLCFEGAEVRSALAARGAAGRVIYAGTYSKPFATGARVGFGILPEALFRVARRLKGNHDFGTSNLLQQLLVRALDSGRYAKHLEALRKRYARKAGVMGQAVREYFSGAIRWEEPAGGLYVWARLPRRVRTGIRSGLFRRALAHEVIYVPGELCYASDPTRARPGHELRLSFGGAREAAISQGIERLGRAIDEVLSGGARK